jgi:hypothetical protein
MRLLKLLAVISTAVACVVLPATAAQAAPACGTTPEQWVGFFPGFTHWDGQEDTPLDHTITRDGGVLAVDTLINDWKRLPPYGTPTLNGDSLTWTATTAATPGGYGETDIYTTNSVTCANGVVQSFTGVDHWIYRIPVGPTFEAETEFSATRAG